MTTPRDPFGPPDDQPTPTGAAGPPPEQGQAWGPPPGQQYGQQYGAPYGGGPGAGGPKRNGLGIAALVVGILSLLGIFTIFGGILLGIVAIILGVLGRGRVKRGEADNGGMAIAGIVMGAISLLVSLALIAAGVAIFNSVGGQSFIQCVEDAGQDQAALDACEREFAEDIGR
jgi:hypothetical protein